MKMIKKLMMLYFAAMAAMGAWAAYFDGERFAYAQFVHVEYSTDSLDLCFREFRDMVDWDGTDRFDEYMDVKGEKFPALTEWYEVLLPIRKQSSSESVTPAIVNGTTRSGAVSATVYTDAQVYSIFKRSTHPSMVKHRIDDLWPNGIVDDKRVWIWVTMSPGAEKVKSKCDVSKRPAAGVYSNLTMSEFAKRYSVDFTGVYDFNVSTWFHVGIMETGEIFPTRFYVFDINKQALRDFREAEEAIIEASGDEDLGEAIVCPAAWYVSPESAGAVEVVAKSTDIRMGMVSGGGVYYPGEKSILVGAPNKGYAFVGWYEDEACTKLFSAPGVDYTKATVNHTVVNYDQTLYAKFKPGEPEDGDGVEVLSSYGPFVPGSEVEINLGLVGYAAKKLPSGLKLDKKTGIVKGKAKRPGEYQVTFTKKGAETLTAKFIVGPMPTITITMEGDIEKCKVTGASKPGKGYLVGQKVSLSAKGPKGTAFTGWFKDGEPWPNETEYLEPKLKYVMTEENLSLVARFEKEKMSVACDGLSALTVGEEVSIPVAIETQSGVKSVKGSKLPSGLKIKKDKATGEWFVTGKPKKVGVWNATITVTAKSGAVEKLPVAVTVEDEGDVVLPSANHYFREPLKNGEGEKYVVSVGISNVEDFLPNLKLTRGSLDVSGLPEGLKYDGASGKITGIATKAGTYTVTLTVTDSKMKYVSTITIEVEALPDWVVGTFNGVEYDRPAPYEEDEVPWEGGNFWDVTMTVSSVGKVSGKLFETNGKVMYIVEGVLIDNNDGSFIIKGWASDEKDDVEYLPITKSYSYSGVELGRIDFESNYYWEDGERWVQDWMLIQDVYSNYPKSEKIPIFRKGIILKDEITDSDIGISGEVRLSFDSKGVVVGEFKPFANIHMTQSKDTGRLILASYDECEDVVYAYVLMSFTHTSNYDYKNHIGIIYKLKIKNLSDVTSNSIEIVEAFYRYD